MNIRASIIVKKTRLFMIRIMVEIYMICIGN